eukprot:3011694-Prorocentrum_lima.AAC.1
MQTIRVWDAFDGKKSKDKPGFLSTKVGAMSLKSVLIKIGTMKEGLAMNMYHRKYRSTGTNGIVDLMAGTDILEYNDMTSRLLQTYRALE